MNLCCICEKSVQHPCNIRVALVFGDFWGTFKGLDTALCPLNVPQTRLLHRCYIDATVSVSLTWTVVAVVPGVFFSPALGPFLGFSACLASCRYLLMANFFCRCVEIKVTSKN